MKPLLLCRNSEENYEWVNIDNMSGLKVKDKLTIVTAAGDEYTTDMDLNAFAAQFDFELIPYI